MTILRTTGLFQFGNQICIYWAGGGPPQCARLIRWHCCGSIHTLARSTKLLQCEEDRPPPFQLFCNSTQDRSKHNSCMTDAPSAWSPSHKDELNVRKNSIAHRAKTNATSHQPVWKETSISSFHAKLWNVRRCLWDPPSCSSKAINCDDNDPVS